MHKISLVINTLNEEKNIANCIKSAINFVDEIIVCDMYSSDNTVRIAQQLGAKIVFHKQTGYVEPARYFAISKASHEWILVLDADERLTEKLKDKLSSIAESNKADVVLFSNLYNYFGCYIKNGGFFNNDWPRFFKKNIYLNSYSEDERLVHNNFKNLRTMKNRIQLSKKYFILHEAYPTFEKYLRKTLAHYALIDSKGRFDNGEKITFFKMIFSPVKEFIKRYFFLKGYKDGKIGFLLCYLKSQYTFYTWLNLWFLNRQDSDIK